MATIGIATFNCENLFSRPRALNLEDSAEAARVLRRIAAFRELVGKRTYDQDAIWAAWQEVKDYVEVNVESGTFWRKRGSASVGIAADGAAAWKGSIVFKRARISETAREGTARVIKDTRADVLCLVEVEGNQILKDFNGQMLGNRYREHLLIDSPNDPRGIDVGLLLRGGRIGNVRTHAFDRDPGKRAGIFSRDCLTVEVLLDSGAVLHVLCNHFKSKSGGDPPESQARRKRQAERVQEILQRFNLSRDLVVVLGDLNDTPDSAPLRPLLATPDLHDVLDLAGIAAEDRWTYYYGRARKAERHTQIDYLLVSQALKRRFEGAEILRRGMTAVVTGDAQGGIEPYDGMTSWRHAASDHAAIAARFDL
jgi:endonuclease/exonuclease/phosphatase family metal-dependent hydrolase